MWYSRKNLVDIFNDNPGMFLQSLAATFMPVAPVIIKRRHKEEDSLYWQYDLTAPSGDDWGGPTFPEPKEDEVLAESTRDWPTILGALMKAVNTGSLPDDAERVALKILMAEELFPPALSRFLIQIDAFLYMAAVRQG